MAWSARHDVLAVANAFDVSLYRFIDERMDQQRITGHQEPVRAATLSADGNWLLTGGDDSRVGLWNIAPDQPNYTHQIAVGGAVGAVAAHPTEARLAYVVGSQVVMCGYDGTAAQTWAASENDLTSTLYSNAGEWLLAAGWDGAIRALHLTNGTVRTLDQQAERINALAFNPSGDRLAAVSRAGRVTVYAWPEGEIVGSLDAPHLGKAIDSVVFSPDGRLLVTGGRDALARLWHADDLTPLAQLAAHRKPVLALGFAGGGQLLATGSGDNTVRLWGVDTSD